MSVLLTMVFLLAAGGCAGGGGGDAVEIDTRVSVHLLDRVYDDAVLYYAVGVSVEPGEAPLTVSETYMTGENGAANPNGNGFWTTLNTWEFEKTIRLGTQTQELVFVVLKVNDCVACQEPVEGEWFSESIILSPEQSSYHIDLFPEFDVMDYHIEGKIKSDADTCIADVKIALETSDGDFVGERLTSPYGDYSFGNVLNGVYVVRPVGEQGCIFDPLSRLVTIDHASAITEDFQAHLQ